MHLKMYTLYEEKKIHLIISLRDDKNELVKWDDLTQWIQYKYSNYIYVYY